MWSLRYLDVMFWRMSLSFTGRALVLEDFLYFDDGLDTVFADFLFGRRDRLVTPTTFSLMGASEIPAMLRAWQRYSPASLYDKPLRMIMDQRTPTRGESCITAKENSLNFR